MPKRLGIAVLSFWPGLPQIQAGQEVLGLILAISFALAVNLAIVGRWIWTEAFDAAWVDFFLTLAATHWVLSFGYTVWWVARCHPERYRAEIDRLYREAIESYLQGRWNDSRRACERILTLDETDADALMQLGTLFARTEQPGGARQAFRQCLEIEGGRKWRWEIERMSAKLGGL
jgi:hypothetical protein